MKKPNNKVLLLPYNFTNISRHLAHYTKGLANLCNYSVLVLNTYDKNTKKFIKLNNISEEQLIEKIKEECNVLFLNSNDTLHNSCLMKRIKSKAIKHIGRDLGADMMIIGCDEEEANVDNIMNIVSKSDVPVNIINRKGDFEKYRRILYPVIEIKASRLKAAWACKLAHNMNAVVSIYACKEKNKELVYKYNRVIHQLGEYFTKNNVRYTLEFSNNNAKSFPSDAMEYGAKVGCDLCIIVPQGNKAFGKISNIDKEYIFNSYNIDILSVNQRDVGIAGGFN